MQNTMETPGDYIMSKQLASHCFMRILLYSFDKDHEALSRSPLRDEFVIPAAGNAVCCLPSRKRWPTKATSIPHPMVDKDLWPVEPNLWPLWRAFQIPHGNGQDCLGSCMMEHHLFAPILLLVSVPRLITKTSSKFIPCAKHLWSLLPGELYLW